MAESDTPGGRQRRVIDQRIELAVGVAALAALGFGCFLVLRPFLSALLWGVILAYTTWPAYQLLLERIGGRRTLAAAIMTVLLALAFILPLVLVGSSAADGFARIVDIIRGLLAAGLPRAPAWIENTPLIGALIADTWNRVSENISVLWELLQPYFATLRDLAIRLGLSIGGGLIEITLSVLAAFFFFFRDGVTFARHATAVTRRIFGDRSHHLIEVAGSTVKGVVYGIVGTALIQGTLSTIGFLIIGIQSAFLLGFVCFVLALLPLGPPLVWIPITIWLFTQGELGSGIFLAVWGTLVISGADNFIRPWLISRGSNLSFLPVFLGVIGGALAFGFLGIFIGPMLLAVGFAILRSWAQPQEEEPIRPPRPPPVVRRLAKNLVRRGLKRPSSGGAGPAI